MANIEIVVHRNDRLRFWPFRNQRQRKACDAALRRRQGRALRDPARVVLEACLRQRFVKRLVGRKIRRAKTGHGMAGEIAPAARLWRNAVDRIGILEDAPERAEFGQPVGLAPVLAVEMAADMAADVMAFAGREPDLFQPVRDLLLRGGKADIRFAGALAGRDILRARLWREQEDAGQKIGEMRAAALGQRTAALPLRDLARAVEGYEDDLLWLRRYGLRRFGRIGDSCGDGGGK